MRYPWYVTASFLVYILLWDVGIIGGTAYVVFWMGHSGWWFLLAVIMASWCFKPWDWAALFDPDQAEKQRLAAAEKSK